MMEKAELFLLPSVNPGRKIRVFTELPHPVQKGLMRYKNILKAGLRA